MSNTSKRRNCRSSVEREAKKFVDHKSNFPSRAKAVTPSLQQLQSQSFSEYIQSILFRDNDDDDDDQGDSSSDDEEEEEVTPERESEQDRGAGGAQPDRVRSSSRRRRQQPRPQPMNPSECEWKNGIVKITMPEGWWDQAGIANDTTARGAAWQEGTKLGDMMVRGPIKQKLAGIGGKYEYALFDMPAMTLSDFRRQADAYRTEQIGQAISPDYDDDDACDELARRFWKRLGPTMKSSIYGADMEGSLFDGADASGWSLESLDNCLQLLAAETGSDHLPGVTTPYLYVGMWASVFCAHTEDMNLLSINYLHAGAPKYWYAIAPEHSKRFESLAESHFAHAKHECSEFLRHKLHLLSPTVLRKAGVPFEVQIQRPGDAIVTCAGSYHFGVNLGFNVAEATNFGLAEWIPKGRQAKVCMCRPHSVRIDMERFEALHQQYQNDTLSAKSLGFRPLSYRNWTLLAERRRREQCSTVPSTAMSSNDVVVVKKKKKKEETDEPVRITTNNLILNTAKDFWVEVMQPIPIDGKGRSSLKRGRKRRRKEEANKEEWRLAKPLLPKNVRIDLKVLCLLNGKTAQQQQQQGVVAVEEDDDADDEQCFAGEVTEIAEGHARIHFLGLPKKEDVWMKLDSPKMFLDGGKFVETKAK